MNVSLVSLRSTLYGTYLKVVLRECLCRHFAFDRYCFLFLGIWLCNGSQEDSNYTAHGWEKPAGESIVSRVHTPQACSVCSYCKHLRWKLPLWLSQDCHNCTQTQHMHVSLPLTRCTCVWKVALFSEQIIQFLLCIAMEMVILPIYLLDLDV